MGSAKEKPKTAQQAWRGAKFWIGLGLGMCLLALAGCVRGSAPPPAEPAPPSPSGYPKPYRVDGVWYQPIPDAEGFRQQGTASWYGKPFHGRRTSSGEIYDMYGVSAAHKTLPFGTMVRVRNLMNDKTLDVRVNDRGPFAKARIIDLSYGAAQALGVVGPGTAPVEIVALATPARAVAEAGGGERYVAADPTHGNFTFQVGAFQDRRNAERLAAKLRNVYDNVHIASYDRGDGLFHRVRVGRATSLKEADDYERMLMGHGYEVYIVAE
jgi:rare lipoprotein A